jgi:hypothetical protein
MDASGLAVAFNRWAIRAEVKIVLRYLLGRPSEREIFIPHLPKGFELRASAFLIDAE